MSLDKFYQFSLLRKENGFVVSFIEYSLGERINAPIIKASYAAYECRKFRMEAFGDHFQDPQDH